MSHTARRGRLDDRRAGERAAPSALRIATLLALTSPHFPFELLAAAVAESERAAR